METLGCQISWNGDFLKNGLYKIKKANAIQQMGGFNKEPSFCGRT